MIPSEPTNPTMKNQERPLFDSASDPSTAFTAENLREVQETQCVYCGKQTIQATTFSGKPLCEQCSVAYSAGAVDYQIDNL